jgi:hypothetical protein
VSQQDDFIWRAYGSVAGYRHAIQSLFPDLENGLITKNVRSLESHAENRDYEI